MRKRKNNKNVVAFYKKINKNGGILGRSEGVRGGSKTSVKMSFYLNLTFEPKTAYTHVFIYVHIHRHIHVYTYTHIHRYT